MAKDQVDTNPGSAATSATSAPPPPPAPTPAPPGAGRRFFKTLYRIVSSHVGLIIILLAYSFVGAAIFQVIEGSNEADEKTSIIELRERIIDSLWNKSQLVGGRQLLWEKVVHQELKKYERQLQEAFAHGINTDSESSVWDFWGSLFYCATIYTTIGYGHIAPATMAGRIVTMIYATIGIPLCLIVLADLGKLFTRAIKFPWAFIRRCYYTGKCTKPAKKDAKSQEGAATGETTSVLGVVIDEEFDEFNLPPIIAVLITVIYILLGAAIYCQWEKWDYLEAFYFIFISISTIGFGDVLPEHPKYFLASSIYVLVGLSLVAMVINVIMEVVSSTIDKAKDKVHEVGKSMGLPLPDDEEEDETTSLGKPGSKQD